MNLPGRAITLKIDGRDVSGREDETILDVAIENGIEIPTLCYMKGLSSEGACRLCLVEVKGSAQLAPSCVTCVREGMEITTHSERLTRYRKIVLELLLSERRHICAICVSNGHCELQALAQKLGVDHVRFPYINQEYPVDASHKRFVSNPNCCVLCTRCVRVCDEIEGAHTLDVVGRGFASQVTHDFILPWGDSETCTSCGKCVHVCPTGSLFEKGMSVAEMVKRPEFLPYLSKMRRRER